VPKALRPIRPCQPRLQRNLPLVSHRLRRSRPPCRHHLLSQAPRSHLPRRQPSLFRYRSSRIRSSRIRSSRIPSSRIPSSRIPSSRVSPTRRRNSPLHRSPIQDNLYLRCNSFRTTIVLTLKTRDMDLDIRRRQDTDRAMAHRRRLLCA